MSIDEGKEDRLDASIRARLQDSVQRLDGHTLSRLTRARAAAVEAARHSSHARWRNWVPAGALAGAAALAVMLWSSTAHTPQAPVASTQNTLDDIELITTDESFELLDDLDFYAWVDTADGNTPS